MLEIQHSLDDSENFFTKLQGLKDWRYLTDFTVKVGTEEIACHKVVLAVRSEYFQHLFNHESTQEVKKGFVDFQQFQYNAVKTVIDYCYTGTLQFQLDDAKDVIRVTDYLQISFIQAKISALIINHVTVDNCINWYFFADSFNLKEVKDKAREVMYIDFACVSHSPAFLAMEYQDFIDCITWKEIDHDSALDAACRWIIHDVQQRKEKFEEILEVRDINNCSASCLKHVITNYGSKVLSDTDLKQKWVDNLFNEVPTWQEPRRGAGYDIIVLGGEHAHNFNKKAWTINLKTGLTTEKASYPSHFPNIFFLASCSNASSAYFVGGAVAYDL